MNRSDDPYGEWLMSYLDQTAPQQGTVPAPWWTWARVLAGVAVMSVAVGASVSAALPGPVGLATGWAVATAAALDATIQTLDQTEE